MSFKTVVQAATSKLARPVLQTQKHSPTILVVGGIVGVVVTVVLASRATLKLEEVLEKTEEDLKTARTLDSPAYSEQDRQKDLALVYTRTVLNVAKLYAPALLVGVASIGALSGSHIILNRRNFALGTAYATLDKGFREYRQRVVDKYGVETESDIRHDLEAHEVFEETPDGPQVKPVKRAGVNSPSIYSRFFDENSRNWSKTESYNQMFINCQQNYANDLLRMRGHVFLNEVYDMLGLSRTTEGAVVGWVFNNKKGGDNFIDFGVFAGNTFEATRFVNGNSDSILLDFNVDGEIYKLI